MKITINKKRIILTLIAAVEIILINASAAFALSIPSPSSVMRAFENRYHLNLQSIREQGELFNVGDQKKLAPQVMLFFTPSDPKPGEKLTAEAMPIYFSTPKESLYYTWYLKHDDCGLDDSPSSSKKNMCDLDKDGDITVNDWKIEAMRVIANDGYDTSKASYSSSSYNNDRDDDGYEAIWGGNDKDKRFNDFDDDYIIEGDSVDYNHCYVHDFRTGINYELNDTSSASFDCPTGQTARCVKDESLACPDTGGSFDDYSICTDLQETPTCNSDTGEATCTNGTPVCTDDLTEYDCDTPPGSSSAASCSTVFSGVDTPTCTSTSTSNAENLCRHLFPSYNGFDGTIGRINLGNRLNNEKVGDGDFNEEEEVFWYTDPKDPGTADNSNKDEGNIVGLGINNFSWNYQPGDKVGVAIEGSAMTPTKHDDSSMMIMWALPKNECSVNNTGSYYKEIKGYNVNIPTADMNLNDCIEDNLIDPTEGGQPKKINVTLSYLPDSPTNDPTSDQMGDALVVEATTDNAASETSQAYYEWNVEISPNGTFNSATSWRDITDELIDSKLIQKSVKGNNLPSLEVNLNINAANLDFSQSDFEDCFPGGIGYLRIRTLMRENFSSGVTREGRGEVMIKVISSGEKIFAHAVDVSSSGRLEINKTSICQDPVTKKYLPLCFVLKNEIIGVSIDNPSDELDNFAWTLNGNPLTCNSSISKLCSDEKQTNYNFFPVTGNLGDTYTVTLSANDVVSGKTIQLVRNFQVVEPFVRIVSADKDLVWPRYLGDYVDLEGNKTSIDNSADVLETFSGNDLPLQAEFHPSWIQNFLSGGFLKTQWTIDGFKEETFNDSIGITLPGQENSIGSLRNVTVEAVFSQPPEIRKALKDIYNVSQFESTENYMNHSVQIETVPTGTDAGQSITQNPGKFLASLASNLPSQINFLFRIILTISVMILTVKVVSSFIPESYEENTNNL